jgi:predicted DNA-binding transcriptional regulator YafY
MRASRLLSILILLQLRVRLTAEQLAEEFEVSVRTIYRDIDSLSAAGIPVYGDRGPGGGFSLLDGYRTKLTGLAAGEAEALPVIGLPGAAAALGLGPEAARVQGKLLAALPPAGSAEAGRMAARFHVDPLDWYRADAPVRHLPALARAVLDQHVVTMRYESWTGERTWRVEPLGLVLKAGAWYLVARGAGKVRSFRVSNIKAQEVGAEAFVRPADFDLPAYWIEAVARFESELRPGTAELRASREGLRRMAALGAWAAEAVQAAGPQEGDGWTCLSLPVEAPDRAALVLLGIGPEIEVVGPADLRARLRELAEQVLVRTG